MSHSQEPFGRMCGEWDRLWRSPREKELSCWEEVVSTSSSICRQCSKTLLLIESEVISNLNRWIYILLHVQLHRWHQKKVYSKINKHLQWWNSKSQLRKTLDSILYVKHLQIFPRLSERRLEEDGFLSMAALICQGLSMQQKEAPGTWCTHDSCAWDSAGQPARGSVCELTRNRKGLETHLASETVLENCPVSVKVSSKSSHSQSMFSLCQVSIFRVKKKPKPKTKKPEEDNKKQLESFQPAISPMAVCCWCPQVSNRGF